MRQSATKADFPLKAANELFETDALQRYLAQCGGKLLLHHDGKQPPHGLVLSLVVVRREGIRTRPSVGGVAHA